MLRYGANFDPTLVVKPDFVPSNDYAASLEQIAPGVTALVDENAQASGQSWIDSLSQLLTTIAVTQQQRELLKIQTDRARQGLPPLNVSQYAAGAQVGISSDTKTFLTFAIGGVVAAMLISAFLRRR